MDIDCETCERSFKKELPSQRTLPNNVEHAVIRFFEPRGQRIYDLWPIDGAYAREGTVILKYSFVDPRGSPAQRDAVTRIIKSSGSPNTPERATWEDFANVEFRLVSDANEADIKIAFPAGGKCLSFVGQNSKSKAPSMWLPKIGTSDSTPELDRRHILHEFGHALGLLHEHESPTRKAKGWNTEDKTNFTSFDAQSIMLYMKYIHPVRAGAKKLKAIYEHANRPTVLSDKDKAFIMLLYPPDLSNIETRRRFEEAMRVAGFEAEADRRQILGAFGNANDSRPLYVRLTAVRSMVLERNDAIKLPWVANGIFLDSLDQSAIQQSYITDYVHGAATNKLLQAMIRNIVTKVFVQNGVEIAQPQPKISSRDIMEMIGALAIQEDVINQVKHYNTLFYPRSASQNGISSDEGRDGGMAPNNPSLDKSSRAHIEKSARSGDITITIERLKRKVELHDGATDAREQSIDTEGTLHFSEEHDLEHAINAHWTPENIVFFRDDMSIAARFVPVEKDTLGNESKTFTGVTWPSVDGS